MFTNKQTPIFHHKSENESWFQMTTFLNSCHKMFLKLNRFWYTICRVLFELCDAALYPSALSFWDNSEVCVSLLCFWLPAACDFYTNTSLRWLTTSTTPLSHLCLLSSLFILAQMCSNNKKINITWLVLEKSWFVKQIRSDVLCTLVSISLRPKISIRYSS